MTDDDLDAMGGIEGMLETIRALTEQANQDLADAQRNITFGSYWARFYDVKNRLVIFGYVEPLVAMEASERELGAGDEEAAYIIRDTQRRHDDGYMYGMAYSYITPEGELGFTHRADIWPITGETFEKFKAVGWDVDSDDLAWEDKVVLAGVHASFMTHSNALLGR